MCGQDAVFACVYTASSTCIYIVHDGIMFFSVAILMSSVSVQFTHCLLWMCLTFYYTCNTCIVYMYMCLLCILHVQVNEHVHACAYNIRVE